MFVPYLLHPLYNYIVAIIIIIIIWIGKYIIIIIIIIWLLFPGGNRLGKKGIMVFVKILGREKTKK